MLDSLQEYIDKLDNPFNQKIIINKNKIDLKYLKNIDFKNTEYIITDNLPNDVAFCVINKDQFDNFDNYFKKEGIL